MFKDTIFINGGSMKQKLSRIFLVVLATAVAAINVNAQDGQFAITGGFRSTNMDAKGLTVDGKSGLQLGGLAWFYFNDNLGMRTGFLYTQKYATLKSTTNIDMNFTYLDIPITLAYKFSDYASVFGGLALSMAQSKDCGAGCTVNNHQSMLTPFVVGTSFKFAPYMGGELVYEFSSSKISEIGGVEISNLRSLGANFVIYFE
jgi:hypothetical protein